MIVEYNNFNRQKSYFLLSFVSYFPYQLKHYNLVKKNYFQYLEILINLNNHDLLLFLYKKNQNKK